MKKKFFDYGLLQLFAEGGDGGSGGTGEGGEGTGASSGNAGEGGAEGGEGNNDPQEKPKYTDKDLDDIIGKKFAKWQAEQDKKIDEAKKLAEMDAQQKAEYERDKLQKKIDELKAKDTRAQMTTTARKMLKDKDVSISDELLDLIVTTDADATKQAVESFADLFKTAVSDAVKEALKGNAPKGGNGGGSTITKEQILAIKDPVERQSLIAQHMDLFKK